MSKGNQFWDTKQYGTQAKAREIALGAVRSYLRKMDIDPTTIDGDRALQSLNDLAMLSTATIAGHFGHFASLNQLDLFVRDWNHWRKEHNA